MTQLRDLLYGYGEGTSLTPGEFTVYNTSITTAGNGGRCCLWTVPAGVTYAVFEMWSGGGSGAGSCCCMQGGGAGAGGYAVKGCNVSPGQEIRICAAASGCCKNGTNGECGCCTFVCSLGGGGQGTWESKVCGGRCVTVETRCNYFRNCYHCCSQCYCCGGVASNVDHFFPGVTGSAHPTQHCLDDAYQMAANAPMTGGGQRYGGNGCCAQGGSSMFGNFPGGGGLSAQMMGGCCCGGPGAGGMVYVVYY